MTRYTERICEARVSRRSIRNGMGVTHQDKNTREIERVKDSASRMGFRPLEGRIADHPVGKESAMRRDGKDEEHKV